MHTMFDIQPEDTALATPFLTELVHKYQALQEDGTALRRRDAAYALGVSEAELIDAQADELCRIRLDDRFGEQIETFHRLGYLMTLTRNDAAVHERKGSYPKAKINGPMGLVISKERKIDLRIIVGRWRFGFAVAEPVKNGVRYSLQFFDGQGNAVQKIFLQPESDADAYFSLVSEFRADDQTAPLALEEAPAAEPRTADADVDAAALAAEWDEITDVHQFMGMLKRHGVSRQQAFRLAGFERAQPFDPAGVTALLEQAAAGGVPIMCFVGNRGNIQIHSGAISRVKTMGPWLNVLDPEFNLHLQMDKVSAAWVVRKPSKDGTITSIELYLENGDTAAQFFGVRTREEDPAWRELAESMLDPERACA